MQYSEEFIQLFYLCTLSIYIITLHTPSSSLFYKIEPEIQLTRMQRHSKAWYILCFRIVKINVVLNIANRERNEFILKYKGKIHSNQKYFFSTHVVSR